VWVLDFAVGEARLGLLARRLKHVTGLVDSRVNLDITQACSLDSFIERRIAYENDMLTFDSLLRRGSQLLNASNTIKGSLRNAPT